MYTSNQRLFLSVLSGILLGFAWNNVFPALIFISLIPLLLAVNDITGPGKSILVFWYSWLSFAIWNIMAGWWIGYASLTGAVALLGFNSFWMAVVIWLYHISKNKIKLQAGYFILVSYWLTFEYIYQRTEISWPWFNLGNLFGTKVEWIQWYEYTGTLGGTLWVLIVNILFAQIITNYLKIGKISYRKVVTAILAVFLPSVLSITIYQMYKETRNPVLVGIIQPNIDPYTEKFKDLKPEDQVNIILDEAQKANPSSYIKYFIAPETAILGSNSENNICESRSVGAIQKFLRRYPDAKFVIGAETQKQYLGKERPTFTARKNDSTDLWEDHYNSALQIDTSGKVQVYHKSKLVVGVEKMPFLQHIGFLENFHIKLGGTYGSLAGQPARGIFKASGTDNIVAPIICFESVYGDYVTDYVKTGANLLFVITNDGWWKNSLGTWQHLNLSRLRAIETRRSIARCANTGISAIINQRGDVTKFLEWNTRGSILGFVNKNEKFTFYARYGDLIGIASLLPTLFFLGMLIYKNLKQKLFFKKIS